MTELVVDPHLFVVFGGRGDLMGRKLLPALYHLTRQGFLHDQCVVLGVARTAGVSDDDYRIWAREALAATGVGDGDAAARWCDGCLHYQSIGKETGDDFRALGARIDEIEKSCNLPGNRSFYLALPPRAFPSTIAGLGEAKLNESLGWTRIVIEKPFGQDLESARELNALLHTCFDERQVYRIDPP